MIKVVFHQIIKTRLYEKLEFVVNVTFSQHIQRSQKHHKEKNSQKGILLCFSYLNTSFVGILTIYCACMYAKSLSHVRLCMTLWTVACQVLIFMEFSGQEYLSGLSCPPQGDLPDGTNSHF